MTDRSRWSVLMKKNVFGKGETVWIDRAMEKFDVHEINTVSPVENDSTLGSFSNKEYFYILRKIFHTFMFDMKEFAIDIYNLSTEEYINALTWLTYVQSIIYKLDLSIEKQASNLIPDVQIEFNTVGDELKSFLKDHKLIDDEIVRCIDDVIKYLSFEKAQIRQKKRLCAEEIFKVLELKSADLEVLRRIILKVYHINVSQKEMKFFKLLDKIREIFDDIRDYEEDLTLKNFNTIIYLSHENNSTDTAIHLLEQYIEQECNYCLSLAQKMSKNKQKKFLTVCQRLNEEKKYYIKLLHILPE
jgi:hypothetical protein